MMGSIKQFIKLKQSKTYFFKDEIMKHLIPQTVFFCLCVLGVVLLVFSSLVELNRRGSAIEVLEPQVEAIGVLETKVEALEN